MHEWPANKQSHETPVGHHLPLGLQGRMRKGEKGWAIFVSEKELPES